MSTESLIITTHSNSIYKMLSMVKYLSTLFLIILTTSCQDKHHKDFTYEMATTKETITSTDQKSTTPSESTNDAINRQINAKKKIIKDGRIGLKVSDLESAKLNVDALLSKYGGYYAKEIFKNTDWESSYILTIRVSSVHLEKMISDIEIDNGEILYKEIEARDVTDQFIDLQTRLENKRSYLLRYNELLKKANSIKEILEIEEKIRGLEEEIESTTGKLKYISDLVDYSTLNLTLSKQKDLKFKPVNQYKFFERLKQSLSRGWYSFINVLLFIVKLWPLWIVAFAIIIWRKHSIIKNHK